MTEQYAIYLAIAYCFGAFIYWYTHQKPKEEKLKIKIPEIKLSAEFTADFELKKKKFPAFENVRESFHREITRPEIEKIANFKRKALKELR